MSNRENWDDYFMGLARSVSTRATCDRKKVGAVIVVDKHMVSAGYNGSPKGMPHCDDVGHELKKMGDRESCVRTVHAEANAIAHAARRGVKIEGSTLYSTASPCYDCLKLIINSGIQRVVSGEFYESRYGMSSDMIKFAEDAGILFVIQNKAE